MSENRCNPSINPLAEAKLDQTKAVDTRYGAAANNHESCLCTPVLFDKKLLKAIPSKVIERDYGCGDPTRWVKVNDTVLDLGSGSGKNAFICAQVVGQSGKVIGVDRNKEMLKLARAACPLVAENIGFSNVSFIEGNIESLDALQSDSSPLIPKGIIDVVLSNCVLNLVNPSGRQALLKNIKRVLKPGGRVAISDIVSSRPVPISLQKDPELWSGCISGAWQEDQFINDFRALGFKNVKYAERSVKPWKKIKQIEFRSVTLIGNL
ncbi:methyltransferase domain-containing protein [Prochlorococcus sp. MIT 1307]|uniref:methyltransferase domain-containing protein n=1 Tax=Prochlorococcus sp. MIT 1307 TaxID=3096219 RepID=UPI002A7606D1|nr:methyltransferase domain-containing protein [Prochlorococcus sp. MIT 1307]